MKPQSTYQEIKPSKELGELVHSFWTHTNLANEPQETTIFPDSFFKIIFYVTKGQIQIILWLVYGQSQKKL